MLAPKDLKVGEVFTDEYGNSYKIKAIVPRIGYDTELITDNSVKTPVAKVDEDSTCNYEEMSIKDLQQLCKDRGLSYRGSKAQVIDRLRG